MLRENQGELSVNVLYGEKKKELNRRVFYVLGAAATALILCVVYAFLKIVPFGSGSIGVMDSSIQYYDFFCFYKDVLRGTGNIYYSFSNQLGQNGMAMFTYYLSSPFNLLVVFFSKSNMDSFMTLVTILKRCTAFVTCAWWLLERFPRLRRPAVFCLSLSYALMSYNIAQADNLMWLDGVYMLPVILLGVYRLVREDNVHFLSLAVGAAILFNWYSAALDCMAAIIWFFAELYLAGKKRRDGALTTLRWIGSMLLGIGISAMWFLPSVVSLLSGKGQAEPNPFAGVIDNPIHTLQNYFIGEPEGIGYASLYCGSLVLIGTLILFASRTGRKGTREKKLAAVLLMVMALMFYWGPGTYVFSMFHQSSYWYRYSYIGSAILIFLAGMGLGGMRERAVCLCAEKVRPEKAGQRRRSASFSGTVRPAALLCLLYAVQTVLVHRSFPASGRRFFASCLLGLMTFAALCVTVSRPAVSARRPDNSARRSEIPARRAAAVILVVVCAAELTLNTFSLTKKHYEPALAAYNTSWQQQEERQIAALQAYDTTYWRAHQLDTRRMTPDRLTLYYDDAFAFRYRSIGTYVSGTSARSMQFLDRLGYVQQGSTLNITNEPVLPGDALLGVKYTLSKTAVPNTIRLANLPAANGNGVYENKAVLPAAFVCKGKGTKKISPVNSSAEPFLWTNEIYSQLMGKQTDVYTPVEVQGRNTPEGVTFTMKQPEGNQVIYGNVPMIKKETVVTVNGKVRTQYGMWESPSVFLVDSGAAAGDTVKVTLRGVSASELYGLSFYAVDTDKLNSVTRELGSRPADISDMNDGHFSCSVNAETGDSLYVSIPYDSGWKVTRNGTVLDNRSLENSLVGDCMYSIPLEKGVNHIEMTYTVPGLTMGLVISSLSLVLLLILTKRSSLPGSRHPHRPRRLRSPRRHRS